MKLAPWFALLATLVVVQLALGQRGGQRKQQQQGQCRKEMECVKGKMLSFLVKKGSVMQDRIKKARQKLERCFNEEKGDDGRTCSKPQWPGEGGDDDGEDGPPSGGAFALFSEEMKKIKKCMKEVKRNAKERMRECVKKELPKGTEPPKGGFKDKGLKKILRGGFRRLKRSMKSVCNALKKCPDAAGCVKARQKEFRERMMDEFTKEKCVDRGLNAWKQTCTAAKQCISPKCKGKGRKMKQAVCKCRKQLKDKLRSEIKECFPDPNSIPLVGERIKSMKECMSDIASNKLDDEDNEHGGPGAFCASRSRNPCDKKESDMKREIENKCERRLQRMKCLKDMREQFGDVGGDIIDQCASGQDPSPLGLISGKLLGGGGKGLFGGGGGGGPGGLGGLFKGLVGG